MADKYIVYTDGGCDSNPGGRGGYAAIILKDTIPMFVTGYENNTTNQRMELKAAIIGLKFIGRPSEIKLFSDSAYVCNCFQSKWYEAWEKNGWKNAKKEPVANKELWEILIKLVKFHESVEFIKVKGHANDLLNNKCDENATDIVRFKRELDKIISEQE